MIQKEKSETSRENQKYRLLILAELLGPMITLILLFILGLLGVFGIELVSGWQLVVIIGILVTPVIIGLTGMYKRHFRIKGSWSEHGSAEVEVGANNKGESDKLSANQTKGPNKAN